MRKLLSFAILSTLLAACTPQPAVAPVEQVEKLPDAKQIQPAETKTTAVKNSTTLYQCAKNKSVRITKSAHDKKTLTVEFNQTSHKLSSAVPKKSKRKYSNIRWIWAEDFNGNGSLSDKSGKILADKCVKK